MQLDRMRCFSCCIADSLNLSDIVSKCLSNGYEPTNYGELIHMSKRINSSIIDIFYFDFGSVVIWGANETQEREILKLAQSDINTISEDTKDIIYYSYKDSIEKTFIDEEKNEIILSDDSVFIKLSISYALAQSVKLNILEISVSKLIEETDPIQKELALTGSISLSKNQISKQIGRLFSERYSINLLSNILDTPEFFWRRPRYEPIYLLTVEFQDILTRQEILNKKLEVIHELYSMLSNELNYKHSARLEVVIVILIALELMTALSHGDVLGRIINFVTPYI
jgi:uncharacterized Rmd1/YagE family protein